MSRKRESELAITEVVTETIGGAVHVALSPRELSTRQRKHISRPAKRARYLTTPCKVDINLRIKEFEQLSPERSETWLYINGAPPVLRFIRHLQPVRVEVGQPIGLECELEATHEPAKIVWYRNGSELIGERYRATFDRPLIGLDIGRSLVDDEGDYSVVVTNAEGEVTSTAPVVVLFQKPTFVLPLKDTQVHIHKPAQLTCRLRALPPAKVTWLAAGVRVKEEEEVEERHRMQRSDEGQLLTLTIPRVSIEDLRKVYTCHAVNEVGEDQTTAKLIPVVPPQPPEFVEIFHDTSVEEGQPLALLAKVIGFPRPTIKWIRNDVVLKPADELKTAEDDDGRCQLRQPEVSKEMAGTYTCVAENEVGLAKCKARISVTDRKLPPIFIVNLANAEAIENDKVTFSCTAQGNPLPAITWYLNDEEIVQGTDPRMKTSATVGRSDVLAHLVIDDVSLDDGGELKAVAKNPVGVACSTANLIVKLRTVKPKLLKGPDDLEITEEDDGRFVATFDGKPPPKIEWFKGDSLIRPSEAMIYASADKTHSLTIKRARLDDRGKYTVKAINVAGETTASAVLIVNEKLWPPFFTEELVDAELIEDDTITLRCSVNAKPTASVAWLKDGLEVADGVGRFKQSRVETGRDEVGLTLTISAAEMTDSGQFDVVARNSQGMASDSARLTVKMRTIAPQVLKGPEDQEIIEDEEGFFQATISGKPEPTVQWLKDSRIIEPSEFMIFTKKDQHTHSLRIRNAQLSNGGQYTVKATNVAGDAVATARLTVHEKLWAPIFTEELTNATALEQDRISFRCSVSAKPLPKITWFKDGLELKDSRRIKQETVKVRDDEVKVVLSIEDAEMTDCGEFEVVARNSEGEASDSTRLTVKMRPVKPVLLKGPADLVITEHEDGYFQATISGKPEPTIQWFKDAQLLSPSEAVILASEGQQHSLFIKKAQLNDGGIYSVKAHNVAGELVANARLIVNEKLWPPIFTKKLLDATLIEEERLSLECTVNAKPLPSIIWYKDSKEVTESSRIELDHANEKKDEVRLILSLKDAELTDCGEFKVVARNSEGQATDSARVIVKMRTIKPFFSKGPNDLVIIEHDDGYFTTTVDGKPQPTVQWFKGVQLIRPSDVMVYASEGKVHSLIVKNAQLSDEGPYTVKAANEAGETTSKATLTVKEKLWAPIFTKKMADKTLIEEDEVSLHCSVSAKPLPSITWLKDGKDMTDVARMKRVETKGKNEVSLSLTVADAEMTDSGEFRVIARNSEGEASDSARLIVKMRTLRPSILKGPIDLAITENEDGYFSATVGGKPAPTIEWLKDNVRIERSEFAVHKSDGQTHSLAIREAQLHDAGRYAIKAINEAGETVAGARLIVNEKLWAPIFLKELNDEVITEEEEISFQTIVNAKPLPSFAWLKDGMDAKENHRILCKSEKIGENEFKVWLTLRDAQIADTGEVKVTARNSEGAAFRSARLTVKMRMVKPRLVKGPVDQVITEEDDGHFAATIDGKPEPTIQWYKDGQLIRPSAAMIQTTKDETLHSLTIKDAQLNAQGIYTIKAANAAGDITADARLTVNEKLWAPVFTQKMTDEVLLEQDEIYFVCTVNAKPLPSISWQKDGRDLVTGHRIQTDSSKGKENELNLSLFISDTELTDTGDYRVIARNTEGQAAITAKLSVNMRTLTPTLLRGPDDLVIMEDEDAQFQAVVEGKPEPTIQWLKDGVLLRTSGSIIYKKKNQTYSLTIMNSTLADRGLYAIKATNAAGELIASAKLTVNERLWAPIFKEKLDDKLAIELDEVTFRCLVSAKPLPSIIWMKDGKELTDSPRIRRDAVKTGKDQVKLSLTIHDAEIGDSGEFEVLARNSEGEALESARLNVRMRTVKPTLLKGPADVIITEDEEAIFVATINGKPDPTVQWYKNNKLLSPSEKIVYAVRDVTHWLTIRNAQLIDGGVYTVKAYNEAGELAANAKLTVIEKLWAPIFTKKLTNATILEQDDISFRCTVSAKPLPAITWLKDNRELTEGSRIKFDCRTIRDDEVSLTLYVTEADIADVGEFKVIAKNSEGVASNLATLTVNMRTVKPILLKGPTDLVLTETEDGHFYAIVDGKPEPKVQWFKDNVLLSPSETVILSMTDRTHSMAIRNAQLHDAGLITIKATNVAGEISATARLIVNERLWAPVFTEKMTDESLVEGEEICLRCTVNAKPLPAITWLKDGRAVRDSPRINLAQVNGKGNEMKLYLTISETELDDAGRFEVIAKNSEGEASESSRLTVKVRTRAPMILKKPDDLVITEDDDGSFFVTVDGKPEPTVHWFKDDKLIKPSEVMVYASRDRTHSLTVKDAQLVNGGRYTVKVVNEVGELAASATLTVKEKLWPPIFTEKLVDKTAVEHEEVRFRCTVKGKPLPVITWIRNGVRLGDSPRISMDILKGAKEDELWLSITLRDSEISDSGEFRIVAKNSEGEAATSARLDVRMRTLKPTLIKGPTDLVIVEGDDAYFWATVAAKPEPTVQWFRSEKLLRPSELVVYENQDETHSLILRNAQLNDDGIYTVRAANEAGELVAKAKLTVREKLWAPVFTEKMSDKTIFEEDRVSWTCTVSAKPLPSISWFKDRKAIQDGNRIEIKSVKGKENEVKLHLTLNAAEISDSGQYSVTAKNSEGDASNSATLHVMMRKVKATLLKGPADLVIIENEDATFTATVFGKPEPRVRWLRNGREMLPSVRLILTKRDQVYSMTIKNAQLDDGDLYSVTAVNDEGDVTASAKLTVKVRTIKPTLLKGPTDLVITEHEDAVFTATIDGKPEPKVQWLKNHREIKPSELLVLAKRDQTHLLTIRNAHLDDAGLFSVKAVNDAGELTATAKLTVNEKLWAPVFTEKIDDRAIFEQEQVFFSCTVNAKPSPSIIWLKDGMELKNSSRVKIESSRGRENETKHTLSLIGADLSDAGKFVVRARNSEGEASCSATVTVTVMTVMPIFLKGPSDLVVIEHEDAVFTAEIDGKPEPKVQWLRNGREIKPSDVFIMAKRHQTHSLTIRNTRLDDGGQYSVKAVNGGGELTLTAKLTVQEKLWAPIFTEKIADKAFFEQETVFFSCAVNAKPSASIIWLKDGMELKNSSRVKIESSRGRDNETKHTLSLIGAALSDAGRFLVRAKNSEGEASCSATVTVTVKTVKPMLLRGPSNLKIEEGSNGSFVAVVDGKPYPDVQWLKDNVPLTIGSRFLTRSSGVEQTLIIKEAKRRDAGVYAIRATNGAGELKASATLEVIDVSPYFVDMLKDVEVSEGMPAVFVCKVYPDSAPVVWSTEDEEISPSNSRFKISSKGNERRLEFVRTTRHDYGIVTATVGRELQSNATLTVEASETEIVETRLLWKIVEDEFMTAAAEFQCTRCRQTAVMRIESMSDPSVAVTERVQSATQRRWVVKKAYINRDGEFRVDRWSVRSYVDYTVTEEALQDVARGMFDRARYSTQTVEFLILLMEPTTESRWLKDGEPISPGNKYAMTIDQEGSLHTLTITDVQQTDEGIYTFMVLRQRAEAEITLEEGGQKLVRIYQKSTPDRLQSVRQTSPGRLLSVKSRQDVDTEALISQLPSPIRKGKFGSKLVMSYDNRQQISTPSNELIQNQLHDFDAKVAGFDEEEEFPEVEHEQEEVFSDDEGGAEKRQKERRSSLSLHAVVLPQLTPLSRASSLSSLSFRGGRMGRAKSEILYFAYSESGKEKEQSDF